VLTQFAPSFHGFYRALISTSFPWSIAEWTELALCLNPLFGSDTIERLNRLLVDVLQQDGANAERLQMIQTLLSRYVANGRPLTGYFIVCCVTEVQWTVLAQCMFPPTKPHSPPSAVADEAEAANLAWLALLNNAVPQDTLQLGANTLEAVKNSTRLAMQNFAELLVQIEEMEAEPAADTYAWETMSESLKLASVCCVAAQHLDEDLFAQLRLLLSVESPIWDMLVQEAALKSTIVLVHNFREIAVTMVGHLRRFVTAPLPIFEIEFASETRSPPPLLAAAKCFALCIQVSLSCLMSRCAAYVYARLHRAMT
jgi:phosphatidylinositol 4-kinase